MRQRKTYISLLIIALQLAALTSCSDELYGGGNSGDGRAVKLKLGYKQSVPAEVVSTRSAATDAENMLKNLQIFVFNATSGKLVGYKWIESGVTTDDSGNVIDLNQAGEAGSVSMTACSGNCYIYGVANVSSDTSNDYSITSGIIPTSATEAAKLKWTDDEVTTGGNDLTIDKLKSIAFQRNTGLELFSAFIMSGVMNDGNLCKIDDSGALTPLTTAGVANTASDAKIIKLRRIVSKITVNVTEKGTYYESDDGKTLYKDDDKFYTDEGLTTKYNGNANEFKISFKPSSCDIVNIPKKGVLIEGAPAVDDNTYTPSTVNFYNDTESGAEKDTYTFQNYYLPENVENMLAKNAVGSWEDREVDNGNDDTEKYFTNAPENGTYLKITGSYSKKKNDEVITTATPVYYIHLGDFGEDKDPKWSNFKVERNCNYTYNITVNGVDSITAEVEKETVDQYNGSVEGISITMTDNSEVFNLDSHYGQVNMTFDQTCVLTDETAATKEYYVFFFSKDIRETSPVLKVSKTASGGDLTVSKNTGVNKWEKISDEDFEYIKTSVDWLEFVDDIHNDTYGDDHGVSYPGKNDPSLKGVFDVIGDLIDKKIESDAAYENGEATNNSWEKKYTCFVNENYYDGMSWSKFVNQTPRYAYICRELQSSHDLRSVSGAVIYGITQKSIQTFYNPSEAEELNAYGVETDPEDNSKCRSSNSCGTFVLYKDTDEDGLSDDYNAGDGRPINSNESNSSWHGRTNFVNQLNSGGVLNDKSKGWSILYTSSYSYYTSARYSCMSRNRDNNGDGVIDADEIRWYPPTIQQYYGLYIGENSIDTEARFFKGKTSELSEKDGNYLKRPAPAYHYWSSTDITHNSNYMYWSEGSGTISVAPLSRSSTNPTNQDLAPWGVACVRNLPAAGSTDVSTEPAKYYIFNKEGTRIVNLRHMSDNATRSTTIDGELPVHAERGSTSYINKPARDFYIAKEKTTKTSTGPQATENTKTVCADYSEETDGSDKGKWRAPNFTELCLLSFIIPDEIKNNGNINCRTKFSNANFRCSWYINSNNVQVTGSNKGDTTKMYMRCVRDAEPND